MAISRYYGAKPQEYVSQFVPENLALMQNALNQRQQSADKTADEIGLYEDALLNQKALKEYDTEQLKEIRSELDEFTSSISKKDLSLPQNAREVSTYMKKLKNDPRLQKINAGLQSKAAYDKLVAKYKTDKKGLQYAIENDEFAKAYQNYLTQEGDDKKFAIDFIGGKENLQSGVDIDGTMESMFNNMSDVGREQVASISDGDMKRYYEYGFTGKTPEHIQRIASSQYQRYMDTPAGQQHKRRYGHYYPNATDEQIESEIKRDLLRVGMERVGVKTTTNKSTALNQIASAKDKKEEKARKFQVSVGNERLANMGVGKSQINLGIHDPLDNITRGAKFMGKFFSEVAKGIDNPDEAFSNGFSSWIKKTSQEIIASEVSPEQTKRIKTAGQNFLNSLSEKQRKGWDSYSGEKKGEVFYDWLKISPNTSVEELAEVSMDSATRQELTYLVKRSEYSSAPVVIKSTSDKSGYDDDLKVAGLSSNPTMKELAESGYKVKDSYVYKKSAGNPGQRLGIVMEDDEGNRITVATKGAQILGEAVNKYIPSEASTYVPDLLTQATYNYEASSYSIPLMQQEYAQLVDKSSITNSDYEPASVSLKLNIDKDKYSIAFVDPQNGEKIELPFYTKKQGKDNGREAYSNYRSAITFLSDDIFDNDNLSQKDKIFAAKEYINNYKDLLFKQDTQ